MQTFESKLKDQVKTFLKEIGAWYFMPVPSGYQRPSFDFIGCYLGQFFAIETKAPGKKLTKMQEATANAVLKASGTVIWGDNIDGIKNNSFWRGFTNFP